MITQSKASLRPGTTDTHPHERRKEKPVVAVMPTQSCPMCSRPVTPNRRGRPRVYCSHDCRRQMAVMREEVPVLRDQLAEAWVKAEGGFWPGSRHWEDEALRLELAIVERESRVVGVLP